ncbi:hypothetical protein M885DRAFT_522366 [Pelagophyceae sp. CCMP2097]|nr:hypothetical protein M885DRAFT_522366 [Pelagophyceae sp. CCMP2097]
MSAAEVRAPPSADDAAPYVKTSGFYGHRPGYVFKMGDSGLGYYLDDLLQLKRHRDLNEEPGIPMNKRPKAAAPALKPSDMVPPAPAASLAGAFNPFDDLPPPEKCEVAPKPPPKPMEETPDRVKVFTPALFQLDKVRCLHIVRKHANCRNPISWRDPKRKVETTLEEASDELRTMRETIVKTQEKRALFERLAKAKSDCSSAKAGGDLGFFRKGKMSHAFENAAFNLNLNEISRVVATSSGCHIIMRIG